MQFTGLLDKNGKEIYEGDIIEDTGGSRSLYEILWEGDRFISQSVSTGDTGLVLRGFADEFTVIGNLYENPGLLAKEAKP